MREEWSVLLIDDHDFVRRAMKRLLEADASFVVTGEAGSFKEALRELRRRQFDLVVMDLVIPGEDGLRFIHTIRPQFPHLAILVVSLHKESLFAEPVLRAGADGFLMKNDASERLVEAAHAVLNRRIYVSPWMQQVIFERIRGADRLPSSTSAPRHSTGIKPKRSVHSSVR